jgi:glycosyltransferase involved in cell wall biosynthesis
VVGRLGESLIVYHCVDEFSQFTGTDAAAISAMEARLAARADLVLVSAGPLLETKRRHNPETFLVTHGVEVEHFAVALDPATAIPRDLGEREQPVVGFFGLIEDWVDLDLVAALAAARPGWSFILIGKIATDVSMLRGLANVELLGWRSYRDLPRYCKGFDAALLPFRINELTLAANPLKLREYLAAGLPTVATDIPEAARLSPLVQVGRDAEELLAHLDAAVAQGSEARGRLAAAMAGETWDRKVEEMSALVERALVARGRSLGAAVDEEKERRSA